MPIAPSLFYFARRVINNQGSANSAWFETPITELIRTEKMKKIWVRDKKYYSAMRKTFVSKL